MPAPKRKRLLEAETRACAAVRPPFEGWQDHRERDSRKRATEPGARAEVLDSDMACTNLPNDLDLSLEDRGTNVLRVRSLAEPLTRNGVGCGVRRSIRRGAPQEGLRERDEEPAGIFGSYGALAALEPVLKTGEESPESWRSSGARSRRKINRT